MTREKEIKKRLFEISTSNFNTSAVDSSAYFAGYTDGVKWADETMLNKACDWLHTALYLDHEHSIEHRYATLEELLNDFRKAML